MIPVVGSAEFTKLLRGLADDIVNAHIHWRLHCDLVNALQKQPVVWAQSRTFWHLTVTAHEITAMGYLCKAFDQEPKSLHLRSLLATTKENLHLFDTAEFRQRLASNPYVNDLAQDQRIPDQSLLDSDIQSCSTTDPLVQCLMAYRGSIGAHRGAKRTIKGRNQTSTPSLSVEDVESLLARAKLLLNRYSNLFSAETYSVSMLGRDDYGFIFSSVSAAVRSYGEPAASQVNPLNPMILKDGED